MPSSQALAKRLVCGLLNRKRTTSSFDAGGAEEDRREGGRALRLGGRAHVTPGCGPLEPEASGDGAPEAEGDASRLCLFSSRRVFLRVCAESAALEVWRSKRGIEGNDGTVKICAFGSPFKCVATRRHVRSQIIPEAATKFLAH